MKATNNIEASTEGAAKFDEADARVLSILVEVEEGLARARSAIMKRRSQIRG